jgi:hypothetical protein
MRGYRLFTVLLLVAVTAVGTLMTTRGYMETWMMWNFSPMPHPFSDFRVVTAGAESRREGHDPMTDNVRDPWQRLMNYPRIWQQLERLGVNQSHTVPIGVGLVGAFLVSMLIWPGEMTVGTAFVLLAGLLSPPVMMAMERGNIELVVFFLSALAIWMARRSVLAAGCVVTAMVLKLFPLAGILMLVRAGRRRFLRLFGAALALTAVYVVYSYRDLQAIDNGTPRSSIFSYGVHVAAYMASERKIAFITGHWNATLNALRLFAGLLLVAGFFVDRLRPATNADDVETPALDAFRLGAAIYLGTFFLGNNWDYRMVFLLFILPQLWLWSVGRSGVIRWPAQFTFAMAGVSLWSWLIEPRFARLPHGAEIWVWLDEVANWLLFAGLGHLLISTLPGWVTSFWRRRTAAAASPPVAPAAVGVS